MTTKKKKARIEAPKMEQKTSADRGREIIEQALKAVTDPPRGRLLEAIEACQEKFQRVL